MRKKEATQRKTPRLQSFDYNRAGAYFITICTQNRRCILSRIVGTGVLDCPQIKLTQYGEIADKYIKQMDSFYDHISVKSYIIMPNHIHFLLHVKSDGQSRTPVPTNAPQDGSSGTCVPTNITRANSTISKFISTFKRFCNKEYGENIWQARANDHIIRNRQDYEEHLRYIHENPMRWCYDELYASE